MRRAALVAAPPPTGHKRPRSSAEHLAQGRLEGVGAGGVVAGGQRGVQRLDLAQRQPARHRLQVRRARAPRRALLAEGLELLARLFERRPRPLLLALRRRLVSASLERSVALVLKQ